MGLKRKSIYADIQTSFDIGVICKNRESEVNQLLVKWIIRVKMYGRRMVVEKCEAKWLPKATLVPAQQVWPKIETNLYNLFIILMELILPVND